MEDELNMNQFAEHKRTVIENLMVSAHNPDDVLFLQLTQREVLLVSAGMKALAEMVDFWGDEDPELNEVWLKYVNGVADKIINAIMVQKEDEEQ